MTPPLVTPTSTAVGKIGLVAVPGGTTTFSVVALTNVVLVAFTPAKLTTASAAKLVPVTVTLAPPAADPPSRDNDVSPRAVTLTLPDVTEVSPDDVNESVDVPTPVSTRFVKVATPATAFTVLVPDSVPGPVATLAVTDAVEPVTTALFTSRTCTTGCTGNSPRVEAMTFLAAWRLPE